MKKLLFFFIQFAILQCHCFARNAGDGKVDSLLAVLKTTKEDTAKVNTLYGLVAEFRFSNIDSALYFAYTALALATKLNYEVRIADFKTVISSMLSNQGKFDEAAKYSTEALALHTKQYSQSPASDKNTILAKIGNTYRIIGSIKISQGNYPEGLKYTLLCLKVNEKLDDKNGIADTEFNLGNIYSLQENYAEGLKYYFASLKVYEELGVKSDIASACNAIGWAYIQQSNYNEADKYCSKALKLAEAAQDKATLAEIYNCLGVIKAHQGDNSQALKYDFEALKLYKETGFDQQLPDVYNNIALVYLKQKKYNDASEYLGKALSSSKHIGSLVYAKISYENLAALDSSQGNFKQSLEHYKLGIATRDSLYNKENTKKMVQQQMQYDFDKREASAKAAQEKKEALALKELQRQKLVRNGFVGGFGVMLLFAGVFFTQRNKIKRGKKLSDDLLLNILPSEVAEELKAKGEAEARQLEEVTVLFTDFKGFTAISEKLTPKELVRDIHECFSAFDHIMEKYGMEKIKTIGDSYMAAGGLPTPNKTHATDAVNAAFEILQFIEEGKVRKLTKGLPYFEIRIGIHTGPVVAGIVGVKKFAYDIWGDTVNIASRMESSGEVGQINISGSTYELVKGMFNCTHRGKIQAKGKGEIDMYFAEGLITHKPNP